MQIPGGFDPQPVILGATEGRAGGWHLLLLGYWRRGRRLYYGARSACGHVVIGAYPRNLRALEICPPRTVRGRWCQKCSHIMNRLYDQSVIEEVLAQVGGTRARSARPPDRR